MSSTGKSPIIISSQDLRSRHSSAMNNNIITNVNAGKTQSPCVVPHLEIVEQPRSKMRFRYPSEMEHKHGYLTGQSTKTWPTVKLNNYKGRKSVFIRATLYTDDNMPHVLNSLYGLNCKENGVCVIGPLDNSMIAVFKELNIVITKGSERRRKYVEWCHQNCKEVPQDEKQIKEKLSKMTNTVRIRFEAYNSESTILASAYSNSIRHKSGHLRILRLSKTCSQKKGGEEVFLLCDKINKGDIGIRFFENGENGERIWEEEAKFNKTEVYHQVAIVFNTPPYNGNITSDVPKKVNIELFQPSDNDTSECCKFEYIENECDEEEIGKKRKKIQPNFRRNISYISSGPSSSTCSSMVDSSESSGSISSQNPILSSFQELQKLDITRNDNFCPSKSEVNLNNAEQQITDLSDPSFDYDNVSDICSKDDLEFLTDPVLTSIFSWDGVQQASEECFSDSMFAPQNANDYEIDSIASNVKIEDIGLNTDNKLDSTQNLEPKHKQSTAVCPEGEIKYLGQKLQRLNMYCMYLNKQNQQMKNFWLYCEVLSEFDFEKYKAHINKDNGDSILHCIVRQKTNIEFILHLLKAIHHYQSLALNFQNKWKETPLHLAIIMNSSNTVELFLKNNADPTIKDKKGKTALHLAAEHKSATCLKFVLQYLKNSPLLSQADYNGQVPLHIAIYSKSIECCKILLDAGADVSQIDLKTGRNNLHLAIIHFPEVINILLEHIVTIDAQDFSGNTALHLACLNRKYSIASKLISAGANPLITNFGCEETAYDLTEDDIELRHILEASTPLLEQKEVNLSDEHGLKSKSTFNDKIKCKILNDATLKKLEDLFISSNMQLETLAVYLGVDDNNLEGLMRLNKNPVRTIISLFEKEGGTTEQLLEALQLASPEQAVKIVQYYINEKVN